MQISYQGRTLDLSYPVIMGILNVTPDSFSDGGCFNQLDKAVDHAAQMIKEGAAIIDIGGESTRPGAGAVSPEEELERVLPAVQAIASRFDVMISVDTSQPAVISACAEAGAHLWNDIRALQVEGAIATAAKLEIPVCLMHMQGQPRTMQAAPHYQDVVAEVKLFLEQRTAAALAGGVKAENIIWDPGFGFGKTLEDNYRLLKHLDAFCKPYPLLTGLSRKSMLGGVTGIKTARDRVVSSVTGAVLCALGGASILRVHDVAATHEAMCVFNAWHQAV